MEERTSMNTFRTVVLGASAAVLTAAGVCVFLLSPASPAGAALSQSVSSPTTTTVSVNVPGMFYITDNTPEIDFTLPAAGYGQATNNPQTVSLSVGNNSTNPDLVTVNTGDFTAEGGGESSIPIGNLTVSGVNGPVPLTNGSTVTDAPSNSGTVTDSYWLYVPPGTAPGTYTTTLQYSIGY